MGYELWVMRDCNVMSCIFLIKCFWMHVLRNFSILGSGQFG